MQIDNLYQLFEDFWYQKPEGLKVRNDSRTLDSFRKKLIACRDTDELDRYIDEAKTRRETMRKITVSFYSFLRARGYEIESELDHKRYYDYPFERQLDIAKYLQEWHTSKEIEERFEIDERTRRSDLEALRDGIEVLGTTIQIREEKKGRKTRYRTTLHPVFLPLNLTEAYALTVYMPRTINHSNPNSKIIKSISDRIKAQLSDYALKRLFPEENKIPEERLQVYYNDDEQLARSREGILMYLMKSGAPCSFYFNGKIRRGRIDHSDQGYRVICDNGEKLNVDPEELEFITDTLEYL